MLFTFGLAVLHLARVLFTFGAVAVHLAWVLFTDGEGLVLFWLGALPLALRLDWPCARAVQIFEPQALSVRYVLLAQARAVPVGVLGVRFHAPKSCSQIELEGV